MTEETPDQTKINDTIQSALQSMESLAFAGRTSEVKGFLTELWPFITDGLNPVPTPEEVNEFAGIALGYLKIGNRTQAISFADNALIVSPTDMLGHAIAPLTDRILIVRHFLHHHQPQKAVALLNAIKGFTPDAADEVDFYLFLLQHYEAEKDRVRSLAPLEGRATLFNLAIWGEAYIEKFLQYSLPSLLAPNNIPALAAADPVIFDIHTTEADRERLAALPGIRKLAEYAHIDYTIIPPEIFAFKGTYSTGAPDRLYVSGAQTLSAMKAKALGADLTFVVTEGLYDDSHFTTAKDYLRDGYKAVLISPVRANDSGLADHLEKYGTVTSESISLGSKPLLEYAANNLIPQIHDLFFRRASKPIFQDVIALYFKTASGFAARTYQISPALISHEIIPADLKFDYHTSDTRLLAELARKSDPEKIYKVITNPTDELFVVDLVSESNVRGREFGEFPVTVEQCVRSALKWCNRETDFAFFEWAFQQRFEFQCDPTPLPDNDWTEDHTVEVFLELFRSRKEHYTRTINYYRGNLPART